MHPGCPFATAAAAAATAVLTSGGAGGAPQSAIVPQPLAQPCSLGPGGGDAGGVSSPRLVRFIDPTRPALR